MTAIIQTKCRYRHFNKPRVLRFLLIFFNIG